MMPAISSYGQPEQDNQPYHLMPGDIIELIVTQRQDLSGEYMLGPDGALYLPDFGTIDLNGLSQQEAQQTLTAILSQYYSPITLVLKVKSYQNDEYVVIMGAVMEPGVYPIKNRITLIRAIGQAKGFTNDANLRAIKLVRNGNDVSPYRVNANKIIKRGDFSHDYQLQANDIIIVPTKLFSQAKNTALEFLPLVELGLVAFITLNQVN